MKQAIMYRLTNLGKMFGFMMLAMCLIVFVISIGVLQYRSISDLCNSGIMFYVIAILSALCGWLSFDKDFNFLSQNGITRSQIHWSFVAVLPVSLVFSMAERLLHFISCRINGAEYHSFLGALFYIERRNVILDILIESVSIIMILCIGYFLSAFVHRVKLIYGVLLVIIVVLGIIAEFTFAQTKDSYGVPLFVIAMQDFFLGSLQGELLIPHLIASQTLVSLIALSLSHIFTLSYTVNRKGNAK